MHILRFIYWFFIVIFIGWVSMFNYMVCLTTDSLDDFVEQGGCGYWKAAIDSVEWSDYLICTKNTNGSRTRWGEKKDRHREAFLILELNKQKFIKAGDRKIITFDRYAQVDSGTIVSWRGQSPIAYFDEEQLGEEIGSHHELLSPSELNWREFSDLSIVEKSEELKLSIKDAKKALARFYDIDEACIKVTFNV